MLRGPLNRKNLHQVRTMSTLKSKGLIKITGDLSIVNNIAVSYI